MDTKKVAVAASRLMMLLTVAVFLGGCYQKVYSFWTDGDDYLVGVHPETWQSALRDGQAEGAAAALLGKACELLDSDVGRTLYWAKSSFDGRVLVFSTISERSASRSDDPPEKVFVIHIGPDGEARATQLSLPRAWHMVRVGSDCVTFSGFKPKGYGDQVLAAYSLDGTPLTAPCGARRSEIVSDGYAAFYHEPSEKTIVIVGEGVAACRVELPGCLKVDQIFSSNSSDMLTIRTGSMLYLAGKRDGLVVQEFPLAADGPIEEVEMSELFFVYHVKYPSEHSEGFARATATSRWWPVDRDAADTSKWEVSPSGRWVRVWEVEKRLIFDEVWYTAERLSYRWGDYDPPTRPRIGGNDAIWLAR